jgi:hypothetical protein
MERQWRMRTELRLRFAGWHPGRKCRTIKTFLNEHPFPAAEQILREFGGLRVSDLEIDGCTANEVAELVRRSERIANRKLYPVASDDCQWFLVDESGIVYSIGRDLEIFASTFKRALDFHFGGLKGQSDDIGSLGRSPRSWKID